MLKNKYLFLYIFSLSLLFSEKFEYLNGKEKIEYKKSEKKKKELYDLINYSEPESWYLLSGIGFSSNQYYSYVKRAFVSGSGGSDNIQYVRWQKSANTDSFHPSINLGFYWHFPKSKNQNIITEQKSIKSPKNINEKVLLGFNYSINHMNENISIYSSGDADMCNTVFEKELSILSFSTLIFHKKIGHGLFGKIDIGYISRYDEISIHIFDELYSIDDHMKMHQKMNGEILSFGIGNAWDLGNGNRILLDFSCSYKIIDYDVDEWQINFNDVYSANQGHIYDYSQNAADNNSFIITVYGLF